MIEFAFYNKLPLIEISAILLFSLVITLNVMGGPFARRVSAKILDRKNLEGFSIAAALTLASQLLVLGAFVIAIFAVKNDVQVVSAFAAAACISFAASMPISMNGWGVREIASVFVLNKLGIPTDDALSVSILIGAVSTILIVIAYSITNTQHLNGTPNLDSVTKAENLEGIEKKAAQLLGAAASFLIFFQIHLKLNEGLLNVNLADPFALLSLMTLGFSCLSQKQLPSWRLEGFNKIIFTFSGILAVGFLIGALQIGVTQWALVGRLLGWLVLLGYLSAGYLFVIYAYHNAFRSLMIILATVAATIVVWKAFQPLAIVMLSQPLVHSNFEGYSANRNTFAIQLLAVMSMVMAYTTSFDKSTRSFSFFNASVYAFVVLGVLIVGIVWTGSRAGMVSCFALLFVGILSGILKTRVAIRALLVALIIWLTLYYASHLVQSLSGPDLTYQVLNRIQTQISGTDSNNERWKTWILAYQFWRENPIFGAGLGVFFEKSEGLLGTKLVVHSTPFWIAAEFGMMGLVFMLWGTIKLINYLKNNLGQAYHPPEPSALLLTMVGFGIFSFFHEIFYQRILWLILGAALAMPHASRKHGR